MIRIVSLYKNAFSGLSRGNWWQAVILLINRSGTMVLPFMVVYFTQVLHYSITEAGWVVAFFGFGAILGAHFGGKLTDKLGFLPVQFWSLFLSGILFFVLGSLSTFWHVSFCTFILSLIGEAFRPANSAATAYFSTPENRTRSYALNRLAINLGFTVGPAIGGILASINYSWLFIVDGITCIAAALVLRLVMPAVKSPAKISKDEIPPQEAAVTRSAYKDAPYLCFIALNMLFAFCFFQLFTAQPVYFKEVLHMQEWEIGLVMGLNGLIIAFLEMVLVYKLEGKKGLFFYIIVGVILSGCSFFALNFLAGFAAVAYFAIVLFTFGEMFSMPFMNTYWTERSNASNRGQYASLYTISFSIAHILASTVGTHIIQHFGYSALWWFDGGVCLVVAGGFWILQRYSQKMQNKTVISS